MREHGRLERLARLWGVATSYRDAFGELRRPAPEALAAVLGVLGAPLEDPGNAGDALEARRAELAARILPEVTVAWEGTARLDLRVRPADADAAVRVRLRRRSEEAFEPVEIGDPPPVVGRPSRVTGNLRRRLELPERLATGYHEVEVEVGGRRARSRLVSAPLRVWAPESEGREWGLFVPLHALWRDGGERPVEGVRSRLDGEPSSPAGGISSSSPAGTSASASVGALAQSAPSLGDLGDLAELAAWTGRQGGSVVGVLPLLDTFLGAFPDPSPYAPASRLFWNELHLDLGALAELPEAEGVVATEEPSRSLVRGDEGSAGSHRYIDAVAEMAWRRELLSRLAERFFAGSPGPRRARFDAFLARRPEAADWAAFRAAGERHGGPWQTWPEPARGGELAAGEDYDEAVSRRHLYAQWLLDEQWERLAGRASEDGAAGLYLDLPLGAHGSSWDVWSRRDLFGLGAAAGCPPDPLFEGGQVWGFPPLLPEASRREGHRYVAAVLAHHLRPARVLRLDHVMHLHRLFWVPDGFEATEGTYVAYPAEELYAVLAVESHRARAVVVGEDLGTVPPAVDHGMRRHGVRGMYVLPFETRVGSGGGGEGDEEEPGSGRESGRSPLAPVPGDALACLGTHDMPSFLAFWEGRDIALNERLGLLDGEAGERERRARARLRRALVGHLREEGLLAGEEVEEKEDEPGAREVLPALLEWLAASDAWMVLVGLEDLWGEPEPQNVPGTAAATNWSRRAARSLGEITRSDDLERILERVDRARKEKR